MLDFSALNCSSIQLKHQGAADVAGCHCKNCCRSRTKSEITSHSNESQVSLSPDQETALFLSSEPLCLLTGNSLQHQWASLSSDLHFHYSPLVNVVSSKCVNSVNVWYVKNWLITWRVCGQLHEDFIKENRLKEKQMSLWQHHPVTTGRNSIKHV